MLDLGKINDIMRNKKAMNAICIGVLCSLSYLAVYYARNLLSAISPHMGESKEYIGTLSSVYFAVYATGQLIN